MYTVYTMCDNIKYFTNIIEKIYNTSSIENDKCAPPEKHGLSNSFRIIPEYYQKEGRLTHVDFFEIIKDDIRNLRPLNKYQMKYIKQMNSEDKMMVIELFNEGYFAVSALFDESNT